MEIKCIVSVYNLFNHSITDYSSRSCTRSAFYHSALEAVLNSLEKFVKHNLGEGQLDHSLGRVSKIFIVDGQASEVLQPGERALNDPSFGKHRKLGRTFVRCNR